MCALTGLKQMMKVKQFLTLASLSSLEALRQPIFLLLTTTCVVVTVLVPTLHMHNFGESGKLARDSGLAFHFVFGLFIAGHAAASSLSREVRSGTASAVLSKPVSRDIFFLAKFAGIACVIVGFSLCSASATLLGERIAEKFETIRGIPDYITDWRTAGLAIAAPVAAYLVAGLINYRTKRPFGSTAFGLLLAFLLFAFLVSGFLDRSGRLGRFDLIVQWRIVPASILVTMGLLVLAAIAMSFSARLTVVPTLTLCSVVFAVGLASDFLFGRHIGASKAAAVLYRIVPNWQHFWVADMLTGGGTISASYVFDAGLYAVIYAAAVLCLGVVSFRWADMK
jgi:ABC-type transport system involved in multi-copper enzyme maturation permease subunit